jgi:hypothetical protein
MGLSVSVGILAELRELDAEGYEYRQRQFAKLNQALLAEGQPPHEEPDAPGGRAPWSCAMWGYSGLHYLRRIAAHLWADQPLPPPGTEEDIRDPKRDPFVDRATSLTYSTTHPAAASHLIWHSDAQGYYLPRAFPDVLFPAVEYSIPGGMIGSAVRLEEECARLARVLEIPDGLDPEAPEVWECASQQGYPSASRWRMYGIETFTCLRLLRACEIAGESGCAVVFH